MEGPKTIGDIKHERLDITFDDLNDAYAEAMMNMMINKPAVTLIQDVLAEAIARTEAILHHRFIEKKEDK